MLVHYRTVGPLESTNQNWLGAKLLPRAVLIYPVACVHSCHLLRTEHHCLWSNGKENPLLACPPTSATPTPLTHPPPYKRHPWYYRGCKKTISKTSSEYCTAELPTYETLAISLLYLYSKSCVTIMYHSRPTAAAIFQNGISWNAKCNTWLVFLNPVTYVRTYT